MIITQTLGQKKKRSFLSLPWEGAQGRFPFSVSDVFCESESSSSGWNVINASIGPDNVSDVFCDIGKMYECWRIRTGLFQSSGKASELGFPLFQIRHISNYSILTMTRRKVSEDKKLVRKITLRLPDSFFKKLEKWKEQSNCRTITELARRILFREKVIWYHKNVELEAVALELALVRKELNAMGRNINQITRHFHATDNVSKKLFQATKAADEFNKVSRKVDQLLKISGEVSKKWLQK